MLRSILVPARAWTAAAAFDPGLVSILLVLWLGAGAAWPHAQSATEPKAHSSISPEPDAQDLYGDPLPPGVRARLGTVRLRHAQSVTQIVFVQQGKLLA